MMSLRHDVQLPVTSGGEGTYKTETDPSIVAKQRKEPYRVPFQLKLRLESTHNGTATQSSAR